MTRAHGIVAAYALLALLLIPVYPHFVSPNEISRWLLAASIVEDGTVEVTRLAPMFGPRFEDLATIEGRLYANKAPAAALLGLPGYALTRTSGLRVSLTAMRWLAATLPLLLLALAFIRLGRRWEAENGRIAEVVFLLLFATPLFAYGLLLFSHALVAAALFGAWLALDRKRDVLAGALAGVAVMAEYPAAIAVAVLLIALLVTRQWRRAMLFTAGGAPFAIALAAFHHLAYGSIFGLPFGHDTLPQFRQLAASGIAGVSFPSVITLAKLLGHPSRGLLVFSPVLVLAVPAFLAAKKRLSPFAWWTLLLVPVVQILVYAGYPNWHGGWTVGPRYIVPAIPFLLAPFLFTKGGRVEQLLGGASLVAVTLTSFVFPFVPDAFRFPWMSLAAPLLGRGLIAPNLLHLVARPLAIAVPLLVVLLTAGFVLRKQIAYALIGVLAMIAIGARPETPAQQWQRAYIAEVYFGERGALGGNPPQSLVRRRAVERSLPPAEWPF